MQGSTSQDHARKRDSTNAARGNTQDMEAKSANLFWKECQGCNEARRTNFPALRIRSSGAIVTSQPWIQLTGCYARWKPCLSESFQPPGDHSGRLALHSYVRIRLRRSSPTSGPDAEHCFHIVSKSQWAITDNESTWCTKKHEQACPLVSCSYALTFVFSHAQRKPGRKSNVKVELPARTPKPRDWAICKI